MRKSIEYWQTADLEKRLCHALDIAQNTLEVLGEHGYSVSNSEEDRIHPEKIAGETALLLLAAYLASGGADCVAARGGIRRRVHQLALKLSPLARSQKVMLALTVHPSLALDFAAPHIYLTRIGYPDLRFDRLLREVLWGGSRPRKERTPHRSLEQEWLLWMGSVPEDPQGRELALAQSALAKPMDLLSGTRDDVYAFTHALMFGTDFDCLPLPLPRSRDELLAEAEAALARCLEENDYDLAGEVLLAWPLSARSGEQDQHGPVWSPAATFGFEVLARVEDQAGFLPSPGTRVALASVLPPEERKKYLLASSYHTVYVMGLLCACALAKDKAPPETVPGLGQPSGAAQAMLAYLDEGAKQAHWYQEFQLLDLEQQDALARLVFQIALRRCWKQQNYAALAELLRQAQAWGLTDTPLASQAAELLERLRLLSDLVQGRARAA